MSPALRRRVLPWAAGLLAASAMCCAYPLMALYRERQRPEQARLWPSDGRFTVLGIFGTETSFEELAYAARGEEAAEHLVPFDPFIRENRSSRIAVTDHLTYRFFGLLQALTGDMSYTWVLARFLLCALWVVLLYHIVLRLTGAEVFSAFCGVFLVCFGYWLTFLFLSQWQLSEGLSRGIPRAIWALLTYGRTESAVRLPRPGLSYAALFAVSLLTAAAAGTGSRLKAISSGVCGGLLLYVRSDVGTTYLGACVLFAALDSWKKKRLSWEPALSALISVLVAVPWFMLADPMNPEFVSRFCESRPPDASALVYLLAALALARARTEPMPLFIASFLASVGLILNLHLLTGCSISPFSWRYFGNIFLFLGALSFLPRALTDKAALWKGAGALVLAAAFLQGAGFAARHYPAFGLRGDDEAALDWLKRNAPLDSVVAALGPEASGLIPVFSRSKIALSFPLAMVSDVPLAENAARMGAALELFGVDVETFIESCLTDGDMPDRRELTSADRRVEAKLVRTTYFHFYPLPRVRTLLREAARDPRPFRYDYVWFGPFERRFAPGFPRRSGPRLREVFRSPTVTIYENADGTVQSSRVPAGSTK